MDRDLYPAIEPFDTGRLAVDGLHTLHVEQCGLPDGVPVVHLHGGPGSLRSPHERRFFDPDHYRVVLFDQRGSGRSTPFGEMTGNTTPHLIADIEAIRESLGIERWIVFGGSWGSALGLAYAQAHPERCLGLVVRGILVDAPAYMHWHFHTSRIVRPEAWEILVEHVPEDERDDLDAALIRRMFDPDPAVSDPVIHGWMVASDILGRSRHPLEDGAVPGRTDPEQERVCARLSLAYLGNHIHLEPLSLLKNAGRLVAIPGVIIHGEDDFNTPPEQAWRLHKAWPQADFRMIPDAGHSCLDRNNRLALVAAMDEFRSLR